MSSTLVKSQWVKSTGKLKVIMSSSITWKFFKLLLIRLESKDTLMYKNLSNANIRTTCNLFNGLKDITILTVEVEEMITIPDREEETLLLISALLIKMLSLNHLIVLVKSSQKINYLEKRLHKFFLPKWQQKQDQKYNKNHSRNSEMK